jgi:hypothetical protein
VESRPSSQPRSAVEPECLLDGSPLLPLGILASWPERRGPGTGAADPQVLAIVNGAALMGLAAVQPMLAADVGLQGEDRAAVTQRCVDVPVGLAGGSIGAARAIRHRRIGAGDDRSATAGASSICVGAPGSLQCGRLAGFLDDEDVHRAGDALANGLSQRLDGRRIPLAEHRDDDVAA